MDDLTWTTMEDHRQKGHAWGTLGGCLTCEELNLAVQWSKDEILKDIADGRIPADVPDFQTLHDYVDANEYGGLCGTFGERSMEFAAHVQDRVDEWLKAGRPL